MKYINEIVAHRRMDKMKSRLRPNLDLIEREKKHSQLFTRQLMALECIAYVIAGKLSIEEIIKERLDSQQPISANGAIEELKDKP